MQAPEHVYKAAFGLDTELKPVESDDPIEIRILAINSNLSKVSRTNALEPILQDIAKKSPAKVEAYMELLITHFSFTNHMASAVRKNLKELSDAKETNSESSPSTQEELVERLLRREKQQLISPAQDFTSDCLYFSTKIDNKEYLISSNRQLISFKNAHEQNLQLESRQVDTFRFSPSSIVRYVRGTYELDTAALYVKINSYLNRFVVFQDGRWATYLSLWIMGTYMFKIFDYYPYVWLNAEKGSGKSLLMKVMSRAAFNADILVSPTPAVIFRDVANNSITMMIDEVEQLRKQDKEAHGAIISLLNIGFERGAMVKRVEKDKGLYVVRSFPAYSPKIFAGINTIDDVLADRTVSLRLLRKKSDELVERYRESKEVLKLQQSIRDDCYVLALTNGPNLARLYQSQIDAPVELSHLKDREVDIWEPIMLLAKFIDASSGNTNLVNAMRSLSADCAAQKQEESVSQNNTFKMLSALKDMLDEVEPHASEGDNKIYQAEKVLEFMRHTEDFGWLDQNKKKWLTRILRKLGIKCNKQRMGFGRPTRVYSINTTDLKDLFERYSI